MSLKVNIYRTFREDQRISMDMYAYYLDHYIKKNYNSVINISSFTPKMMISKFLPSDTPEASEENKTHLILRLLSPSTVIFLLNFFIFFLIEIKFGI